MHADDKANRCGQFTGFPLDRITERLRQLRFQERGLDGLHGQVYAAGPFQVRMPAIKHEGSIVSLVRHGVSDLPSVLAGKLVDPFKQLHVVLYACDRTPNCFDVAAHYEADELLNIPGHLAMVVEGWLWHKTADYVAGTRLFTDLVRNDCGFHLSTRGRWLLAKWDEVVRAKSTV